MQGKVAFKKQIALLYGIMISLILLTGCGNSSSQPASEAEEAPTPETRLDRARTILKDAGTPEALTDERIISVERELKAVPRDQPEAREAAALLKALHDHVQARGNPEFWVLLRRSEDNRAEFARLLPQLLKKQDPQVSASATGYANTDLAISSPTMTAAEATGLRKRLVEDGLAQADGFIRLRISDSKITLISEILAKNPPAASSN